MRISDWSSDVCSSDLRSLESSSHRQQAEDLTQTIEALERRLQKIENMARITPKRGRVSTRNSENDRRNKGSEYSVKALVAAKLDTAIAHQDEFAKEAGSRRSAERRVGNESVRTLEIGGMT